MFHFIIHVCFSLIHLPNFPFIVCVQYNEYRLDTQYNYIALKWIPLSQSKTNNVKAFLFAIGNRHHTGSAVKNLTLHYYHPRTSNDMLVITSKWYHLIISIVISLKTFQCTASLNGPLSFLHSKGCYFTMELTLSYFIHYSQCKTWCCSVMFLMMIGLAGYVFC